MKKSKKGERKAVYSSLETLDFEIPSWERIHWFSIEVAEEVKRSKFNPDIIVGISRGGWVPARIISDLLEKAVLANVSVEFYEQLGETKGKPTITQPISISVKEKKLLLVDDVADTGQSLALVKKYLKDVGALEIKIASVYYKPWSTVIPDYYRKETSLWIIFPWEVKESLRKIFEKFRGQNITVDDIKQKLLQLGLDGKLIEKLN
jgi:hypoxanthine phosphoribosyltransferase